MPLSPSERSSVKEEKSVEDGHPAHGLSDPSKGGPPGSPPDDSEYPPMHVTLMIMSSVFLSMFLVSLDRLIVSTAIPYITDEFNSITDIGWYGSSYMLANCSIQPLYGKIYKFYSAKWVLLCAITMFEIGSALCGAAPNSNAFIVGRAIAGAGSAGVMSGTIQVMLLLVPLSKRAAFTGIFSSIFGVSSAVGPLLGGVFTQKLSWRWCFYINLPIAAPSMILILLLLKTNAPRERGTPAKEQIKQLDPLGTIIFIPSIVCLLLALQWGGAVYAWSSGRVIALLVVFATSFPTWIGIQIWEKDRAIIPMRILCQRSIICGFLYAFFLMSSMMIINYYIAIWFQAIKGVSPVKSGISTLPFVLALVVSATISGFFVQKIGYYVPTMILGPCISSIGAGLLTTFSTHTNHSHWIAYQFLYGFGMGMGMQQPTLAAQAILPRHDASIGVSIMFVAQQFGGAVFLSVAENVFDQRLVRNLSRIAGLGLDPENIVHAGATDLRRIVPAAKLPDVLVAYNTALVQPWYVAVALTCLAVVPASCMEWKNIKGLKHGGPAAGKPQAPPPSSAEKKDLEAAAQAPPAGMVVPPPAHDAQATAVHGEKKSAADDVA